MCKGLHLNHARPNPQNSLMYSLLILSGINSRHCIMVEEIVSARVAGAAFTNTATNSATIEEQFKGYFCLIYLWVFKWPSMMPPDILVRVASHTFKFSLPSFWIFCLFSMWLLAWIMHEQSQNCKDSAAKLNVECFCVSILFSGSRALPRHTLTPSRTQTHKHILNGVHGPMKQQPVTGRENSKRSV